MSKAAAKTNVIASSEDWEFKLDNMGTSAPREALEAHLALCPDRSTPAASALIGLLSSPAIHGA